MWSINVIEYKFVPTKVSVEQWSPTPTLVALRNSNGQVSLWSFSAGNPSLLVSKHRRRTILKKKKMPMPRAFHTSAFPGLNASIAFPSEARTDSCKVSKPALVISQCSLPLSWQRAIARVMQLINGVSHGGLWLKGELIPLGRLYTHHAQSRRARISVVLCSSTLGKIAPPAWNVFSLTKRIYVAVLM